MNNIQKNVVTPTPKLADSTTKCAACGKLGAEYEVRLPKYKGKLYHACCCPEYKPYPGD